MHNLNKFTEREIGYICIPKCSLFYISYTIFTSMVHKQRCFIKDVFIRVISIILFHNSEMLYLPDGLLNFLNEVNTIPVFIQLLFDDTKFTHTVCQEKTAHNKEVGWLFLLGNKYKVSLHEINNWSYS